MENELSHRIGIGGERNTPFDRFNLLVSEFNDLVLSVEFSHGFESEVSDVWGVAPSTSSRSQPLW